MESPDKQRSRKGFLNIKEERQPLLNSKKIKKIRPLRNCNVKACIQVTIGTLIFLILGLGICFVVTAFQLEKNISEKVGSSGEIIVDTKFSPETLPPCVVPPIKTNLFGFLPCGKGYCPQNYSCENIAPTISACTSNDIFCNQLLLCYEYIDALELIDNDTLRIIPLNLPSRGLYSSVSIQILSLILTIVMPISIMLCMSNFTATQTLLIVGPLSVLETSIGIAGGIIVYSTIQPDYWSLTDIVSAGCFGGHDSWLEYTISLLLLLAGCTCFIGLLQVLKAVAILSYKIPDVSSGFWNSKSLVQIAVWATISMGFLLLIMLVTSYYNL